MARSHLTLAALATSAVPGLTVAGSGPLGSGSGGDIDSALLRTTDDREVVIRVPAHERAASEQSVELLALQAMTQGIRSRLPFEVPEIIGQTTTGTGRAVVYRYLPGYTIEAEHLPGGDGAATSMGASIAAIHSLPGSFVSAAGLPHLQAADCRAEARNILERASTTGKLPAAVKKRWADAIGDDAVWQFQPTVINGSIDSESFIITDHEAGPVVSGVIGWASLRVGDPAMDLHWLSAAPDASASVFAAYRTACTRHPDRHILQRSLLHAELELARWLLHGVDRRSVAIVDDAVAMLDGLVDSVLGELMYPLTPDTGPVMAVDEVEAMLQSAPPTLPPTRAGYTMETDSYDADEFIREFGSEPDPGEAPSSDEPAQASCHDETDTSPIELPRNDQAESPVVHRSRSSASE